jgi:hypothetical protein
VVPTQTRKLLAFLDQRQTAVDKFIDEKDEFSLIGSGDIGGTIRANTLYRLLTNAQEQCFPDLKLKDANFLDLGSALLQLVLTLEPIFKRVGGVEYQESLFDASVVVHREFPTSTARVWPANILRLGMVKNVDILFSWCVSLARTHAQLLCLETGGARWTWSPRW